MTQWVQQSQTTLWPCRLDPPPGRLSLPPFAKVGSMLRYMLVQGNSMLTRVRLGAHDMQLCVIWKQGPSFSAYLHARLLQVRTEAV
jgi:hypothetical protein